MHSFIIETSETNNQNSNLIDVITKQTGMDLPLQQFNSHPDIHHLNPEQKTVSRKISIEAVRQFQEIFHSYPFQLKFHLGLIWEAETLTTEAQQALLKLLEEPGENVYLFLITKSPTSLLPTIRSRCALIKQSANVVTEHCSVTTDNNPKLENLLNNLNQANLGQRLQLLEPYSKNRLEALALIEELINTTRSSSFSNSYSPGSSNSSSQFSTLNSQLSPSLLKHLTITYNDLSANIGVKLALDQLAINWPT